MSFTKASTNGLFEAITVYSYIGLAAYTAHRKPRLRILFKNISRLLSGHNWILRKYLIKMYFYISMAPMTFSQVVIRSNSFIALKMFLKVPLSLRRSALYVAIALARKAHSMHRVLFH